MVCTAHIGNVFYAASMPPTPSYGSKTLISYSPSPAYEGSDRSLTYSTQPKHGLDYTTSRIQPITGYSPIDRMFTEKPANETVKQVQHTSSTKPQQKPSIAQERAILARAILDDLKEINQEEINVH